MLLFVVANTHLEGKLPNLFLQAREGGVVSLPLRRSLVDSVGRHTTLHKRIAVVYKYHARAWRHFQPRGESTVERSAPKSAIRVVFSFNPHNPPISLFLSTFGFFSYQVARLCPSLRRQ